MLLMERYYFYLKDYSTRLFQLLEWEEGNGAFHLKAKLKHSRVSSEKPESVRILSVRIYNAPKGCFGIIVSFSDLPEWLNHYNQVIIKHLKSFSHTHSFFFFNFSKFSWAWSWWLRLLPYSIGLCIGLILTKVWFSTTLASGYWSF